MARFVRPPASSWSTSLSRRVKGLSSSPSTDERGRRQDTGQTWINHGQSSGERADRSHNHIGIAVALEQGELRKDLQQRQQGRHLAAFFLPGQREDGQVAFDLAEAFTHGRVAPSQIDDQGIRPVQLDIRLQTRAINLREHDAAALCQQRAQSGAGQEVVRDDQQMGFGSGYGRRDHKFDSVAFAKYDRNTVIYPFTACGKQHSACPSRHLSLYTLGLAHRCRY